MQNVMLAVLAGGEGSRMGRPKGELRVGGQPILEYLLRRWDWPGVKVLVTAPGREHPPGWERFDREVHDATSGEGPLRGVVTALENAGDAAIVVFATCDMPLVTRAMLEHLEAALTSDPSALAVMTRRGDDIEPFPIALRPAAVGVLRERIAAKARSVHTLATLPQFRLIDAPAEWHDTVWTNLNHPQDFERFIASHCGTVVS